MKFGRFSVSAGALLMLAAVYFFDAIYFLPPIAAAVFAHELGHYLALRFCGGRISEFRLEFAGAVIVYGGSLPYVREMAVAAAGPAASLIFAVLTAHAARFTGYGPLYQLSGMSLVFCLFNLLPVCPLDGGKILFSATARVFGLTSAERVSCVLSCAVIFATLTGGAVLFAAGKRNVTLLAAGVWLFIYYCKNGNDNVVLS